MATACRYIFVRRTLMGASILVRRAQIGVAATSPGEAESIGYQTILCW